MKLKTNEGGFTKKLHKAFRRVLLAQCLDAGFDQFIHGTKMSAADFLADQAFGFWGNIDVHGVVLLLSFKGKGYRGVCHEIQGLGWPPGVTQTVKTLFAVR